MKKSAMQIELSVEMVSKIKTRSCRRPLNGSPVHSTQFITLHLLTAPMTKSGRMEGCVILLCGRIARI